MRSLTWGARSASPQQQRPQQQHQQRQQIPPQHQSQRPQQPPSQGYHPFQTLQMPKQPSMCAVKVVASYAENTPPRAGGSHHIATAKSPTPQMVKSPPQLIMKTPTTPRHHAIIVPIESPGRSSSSSKDDEVRKVQVQSSPSNVATGNDGSPQKPLIPFGNSYAANNNRMSPSTARRGGGGGRQNHSQPLQTSRDQASYPTHQQEQQGQQQQQQQQFNNNVPSTYRPEMGQSNGFSNNPLSPIQRSNTPPQGQGMTPLPIAASATPCSDSRSFSAGTNGLVERLEASDAQVKALKSEVCRLKAVTADEERIEQNRAELRKELSAAEELMKGQAGKEAQIIQLQSALITAENKGYMTQQRLEEVERLLCERDAVSEREAEEVRAGCRAEVEKMEEMLSDVCGELDIVKTGAKGVQAENGRLRSALAQLEVQVMTLTSASEGGGAGGGRVRELEERVAELEGLLESERKARTDAEAETRRMCAFAEAKQKEAEEANFSALAAVREAEELEEHYRAASRHARDAATPGQHHGPRYTQTPTSHHALSPALIPGTHPSWNEAQCLLPPSSPSPPPADVSPQSSFWPFSAISQGSDPTLSPTPPPPPRQGEWGDTVVPSPPLPALSVQRERPQGSMLSFRLFELGSGSEAAAAVLQVERGLGFEEFRAKCMASIGCRIVHFRYNDERTQRFGLECKSEADWEELQRSARANDCTNLLAVAKPSSCRAQGEVQC